MKTKIFFCANCQDKKEHELSLSGNGEIVATCDCGRFIKFPSGLDKKDIDELAKAHEEANKGQVSVEAQEKLLADIAD